MQPIKFHTSGRLKRLKRAATYVNLRRKRFVALLVTLAHIAGALTSVQAVMETRTAQGAIAWAVSLNTIPYAAVPAYWAFGRTKFQGYVKKRQEQIDETSPVVRHFIDLASEKQFLVPSRPREAPLLERLTNLPATVGNHVELLRNGEEIFPSIFQGLEQAQDYLLVQFYIVRDDFLGRELQSRLIHAAQRGVRVKFLYDEIGCYQLPRSYLDGLREGGVKVNAFNSTQGRANPFQINFRNHRKIVVVDGRHAWVGGANVGDEYLGLHPRLSPWVDTMVRVTGPAVQAIQVPFLEDWYWASGDLLDLDWTPQGASNGTSKTVFILPTGPADRFETCALYFLHAINSATHRFWIASPYFVPDEQIVSALQLAALRGVDVRILVPEDCDNRLVRLSGWSYVASLEKAGVKVYRFINGFLHHKVMLVDDATAAVGTANFDNRSFRLNFEITLEVQDEDFAGEIEELFLENFADSRLSSALELEERSFPFRLAVRIARLMSPIQ
ncbi:cardiolipin synthase [Geoalkalibacter halelectricus]|uniref:Cardiolipin synthase n=1 Tax=Geoalkalibacter halelectricus TaxID=2847045 RepID=A0ABY5ZPQ1_9BACT|nr:cardiolipin synthase [Geoalkalibacter halelectricus]MDO3379984.1 cardiolipin synthase [Geoalkalibacter halelectricus]UWZ80489.1 cardiolipin synthase [Geoalkalibacter halelectricus]